MLTSNVYTSFYFFALIHYHFLSSVIFRVQINGYHFERFCLLIIEKVGMNLEEFKTNISFYLLLTHFHMEEPNHTDTLLCQQINLATRVGITTLGH